MLKVILSVENNNTHSGTNFIQVKAMQLRINLMTVQHKQAENYVEMCLATWCILCFLWMDEHTFLFCSKSSVVSIMNCAFVAHQESFLSQFQIYIKEQSDC